MSINKSGVNDVFVVVPNWNGLDFIEACLDSLQAQTLRPHIIVVDNGSVDGSCQFVENKYDNIEIVKLPVNKGFTGGVNAGIERALSEGAAYIILLNNDAVAEKDWVEKLVTSAKASPESGIVTGKFLRMDKKHLDSTGDFYTTWGLPYPRGRNEVDTKQYDNLTNVFGATGGATLYKAGVFNEIGLFDDDFFAYFEDVDLSFRAQLAGWRAIYEPAAVAYHHVSGTSSKLGDFARFHSAKNFMLVYAKNMPRRLYIKYLPLFVIQLCRMSLSSFVKGKFLVFVKGSWAAIMLYSSTRSKRKHIQSTRKVTDKYIDNVLSHHRPPKPPVIEVNNG